MTFAGRCNIRCSSSVLFVACALFGEVRRSLFVAGALFGEILASLFVAVAVFDEIWNGSRSAKPFMFP